MMIDRKIWSIYQQAAPPASSYLEISNRLARESGLKKNEWLGMVLGFYFANHLRHLPEYKLAMDRMGMTQPNVTDDMDLASIILGKTKREIMERAIHEAEIRAIDAEIS